MRIGSEPGSDRSAAELAGLLALSRESVHQLLAPYVRSGLLVAVRGRSGGYRAGPTLPETPLSTLLAPFAGPSPRPAGEGRSGLDSLVDALEAEAEKARLAIFDRYTLGDLVARLRAERQAIDWEI